MGCVYLVQKLADGKAYVGQTVKESLIERYRDFSDPLLDRGKRPIDRAFTKYGGNAFQFIELMKVPKDQLDGWERWWIKALDSTNRETGYNLESGGNKKKTLSPETKAKMSASQKGRPMSQEMRVKLQPYWDSLKGKYKPWPESRKASYTKAKHPLYKKRVWVHPEHGTFEGSIVELIEAFPEQNLSRGNLSQMAHGAYGYNTVKRWTFAGEAAITMSV